MEFLQCVHIDLADLQRGDSFCRVGELGERAFVADARV